MRSRFNLFEWYFSKRTLPYWCVLLLDCFIILCSGIFVYWAFYRGAALQRNFFPLIRVLLIYIAVSFVFFRLFRTYAGILRFSSFKDLIHISMAMGFSFLVSLVIHLFVYKAPETALAHLTARSLLFIFLLSIALMWLERIMIKLLYDASFSDRDAKNTFIYGTREGGVALGKFVKSEKPARYNLKGFISHDPAYYHKGTYLLGEPVFSPSDDLESILEEKRIKAVLVPAIRLDDFRADTDLQDRLIRSGVKIYFAQSALEAGEEDSVIPTIALKEVSVEDLLPRDVIDVDLESVAAAIAGKRILVTGSAGSIGSEIVRQVASFSPEEMMLIDSAETPQHDIRLMMAKDYPSVKASTVVTSIANADRMEAIFSSFRPDIVFHAAAYKHVPMMEDNPSESIQNNVYGTKVLADLSVKYGVSKFVMISTDKAVNPTNVMGCSKRICEIYVQSLDKAERDGKVEGHTQFVTTRFGNVLGSNGSVIPIFEKQIKSGGPVTVTHPDVIRYFMLIPEACKLVLEAGTKGNGGEIFVFDMGKPVKIADLAKRMIELSGAKGVEIKFTGLRDGEKLYEEVLGDKEVTKPSFHEKIRIAVVREYDFAQVKSSIEDLIAISHEYDDLKTVAAMKHIVPEFISNHSVYSVLDK
ncbi:MAG: polysaccharide biosynthesis protein [Bacteroidales bacterium]|nr:polysaccharide biosynthesis protein [Bacteroidales bacterium]